MCAEHDGHEEHEEHVHEHLPSERKVTRPLIFAFTITICFAVFELFGGLFSGSLGLVSDSGHMFTDALALALSLGAAIISTRESTDKQTFGYLRVEIVAALANGIVLIIVSAFILYGAYQRYLEPHPIDGALMLGVAVIGLGANVIGAFVLHGHSHDNLNVKGAFLHVLGDLLSSVGVIVAAILIFLFNFREADPIISAVIGVVIMYSALGVVRQALIVLLEFAPSHVQADEIRDELMKVDGVVEVHDIHMWTLASGIHAMSGHIVVKDQPVSACSCIVQECEELLRHRFKFSHTTLQLESNVCDVNACYFRTRKDDETPK
ncbi:MAG: zinc transporter ZitB [Methanomassiliicoccales archaeon PtaU1.Bin124]|nr:MAG: zinc transporter ZitB [Methanomassiliicoccales archaeon PtaU1.Bin124]